MAGFCASLKGTAGTGLQVGKIFSEALPRGFCPHKPPVFYAGSLYVHQTPREGLSRQPARFTERGLCT